MLTQIRKILGNLVPNLNQSDLDRFISEHRPQNINDVEFLTREYEYKTQKGVSQ